MKRLLLLAALVAPLWGCAQPAEGPANANLSANANAPAAATPAGTPSAAVADAVIIDREKAIWDTIKRKDAVAFGDMLTDDFIYVSNDNIYDKKGTIDGIKEFTPTDMTLSDWKVVMVDRDAAVVTYSAVFKGTMGNGQPMPNTPTRASSLWVNRGGKWLGLYHQDTDAVAMTPPPAGNANTAAKDANANLKAGGGTDNANGNSNDTTAETADPITKEKHLWEELKRKNWDAFASDLADNAIEVEPKGVFDKAGSIGGVKNIDFSKYTLSDWKQTKIDDDAALVTYMVKGGEYKHGARHSTIWAKRGDRWLAVFHQSTPSIPIPPPAK